MSTGSTLVPSTPAPKSFWDRITSPLVAVGALVAILGPAMVAVGYFSPLFEHDLTVWIQHRLPVLSHGAGDAGQRSAPRIVFPYY